MGLFVGIASDHAGVELKEKVKEFLKELKIDFQDFGTKDANPCDYPDYAVKVSNAVVKKHVDFGILICSSGLGTSIAANKIKGIRAALCFNDHTALLSRNHNNANVLCLGAEYISDELNEIVHVFLNDGFDGGRHQRRLDKVTGLESQV